MNRIIAFIVVAALAAASPALAQNQDQFASGMRSIKVAVNDFQKTIDFYSALGMKAGTKHSADAWDLVWDGKTQNVGITMVTPGYAERAKMTRGGTYFMMMTPDVKAVADKLRKAGYPDVAEPRAMGTMVTVLMLTDPDGNRIELMGPLPAK